MASCPCLRPRRLLQAEPFFFAATKIRIGRGRSLPLRPQQVKPFFFAATKIRIGRETTPPQRPQQAKLFFIATTKIRIRRGALWWQGRLQQAKPFSPASILKSGPEIKNRCTQQGINRQNPASIPKSSPEIKNRCTNQPIFSTHPQHIPPARIPARVPSRVDDVSCLGCFAWGRAPQWLDSGSTVAAKRVLMRPEAAFPYVSAAEGAQHPPKKPPRSTPRRHEKTRPDAAFIIRGTRTGTKV